MAHGVKLLLCAVFLPKTYACGKYDRADDSDRLREVAMHNAEAKGNGCSYDEDKDDWVLELLKIQFPPGCLSRRSDEVGSMSLSALGHSLFGQSF